MGVSRDASEQPPPRPHDRRRHNRHKRRTPDNRDNQTNRRDPYHEGQANGFADCACGIDCPACDVRTLIQPLESSQLSLMSEA